MARQGFRAENVTSMLRLSGRLFQKAAYEELGTSHQCHIQKQQQFGQYF